MLPAHPSKLKHQYARESRNVAKAGNQGGPDENSILWIQQGHYTHELPAAVATFTRPPQDQTSQHSSIEVGRLSQAAIHR